MVNMQTFYFNQYKVESRFSGTNNHKLLNIKVYKRCLFFWKLKTHEIVAVGNNDSRSLQEHSEDFINYIT